MTDLIVERESPALITLRDKCRQVWRFVNDDIFVYIVLKDFSEEDVLNITTDSSLRRMKAIFGDFFTTIAHFFVYAQLDFITEDKAIEVLEKFKNTDVEFEIVEF